MLRCVAAALSRAAAASPQLLRGPGAAAASEAAWRPMCRGFVSSRGLREEEDDGIRPPPISPCDSMGLYITDLHFDEPDPNYYKNALLSDKVKDEIFKLSKTGEWPTPKLAEKYKVRQQRIMAIVALKELEARARAEGKTLYDDLEKAIEMETGVVEEGTGETLFVATVTEPSYEVVHDGVPEEQRPEALITAEASSAKLDALQIEDFARRLDVNMGRFAVGLAKRSRIAVAPRRPAEGWSLLVKPLGAGAGGEGAAPFVAMPDGKQRPLSQLERDYVELNKVRPRRKLN